MKILHLSNTPLSNSPANIANCQRQAGHEATVLLHKQSNINKVFVGGKVWMGFEKEQLHNLVEGADVIHMHNFAWQQEIFKHNPDLIEKVKAKPCLIQYHSPRDSYESFEETLKDPFFNGRKAVLAQYHVRQYPEAEHIVPNCLPIFDQLYMPVMAKWGDTRTPPTVSFAPSNTHLRGWDYKGYDVVLPALNQLSNRRLLIKEIITNTPYTECLMKKSWAHIGIEEFVTGSYHLSFLEYMSVGCSVMGYLDQHTLTALERVVGLDAVNALPYTKTNRDRFERDLYKMVTYPGRIEVLKREGMAARNWMEMHWHPKKTVGVYERVYASL